MGIYFHGTCDEVVSNTSFNCISSSAIIPTKDCIFYHLISGAIRDSTGSFDIAFHIMGICFISTGLILFTEPLCRKLEDKRVKNNNT